MILSHVSIHPAFAAGGLLEALATHVWVMALGRLIIGPILVCLRGELIPP
jgi:hypothetical protein